MYVSPHCLGMYIRNKPFKYNQNNLDSCVFTKLSHCGGSSDKGVSINSTKFVRILTNWSKIVFFLICRIYSIILN